MAKKEAIVYGRRACLALAEYRSAAIKRVFYEDGAPNRDLGPLLKICAKHRKPYRAVSVEELYKISGSTHHEGVVTVTTPRAAVDFDAYVKDYVSVDSSSTKTLPIWVAFDRVENDHNHGAIARTLSWFGAEGMIWEAKRPQLSASALRIAQGGAEHISLLAVSSLSQSLQTLKRKGVLVLGADQYAEQSALNRPQHISKGICWVMGSEQFGLSKAIKKHCDALVSIPGSDQIESLNVSVSAGVLISQSYQWLKDR